MTTQAPSQLEGGGRVAAGRLLDLQTGTATTRGTLFHAWFEQIHWLEDGAPDEQTLRRIAQQHDCAELPLQPQVDAFHLMLQHPAIAAVLQQASYQYPNGPMWNALGLADIPLAAPHVEVHNEQRLAVRHEGQLLTGFMDRLVLLFDGERPVAADIIDYKTDSVPKDDPHHVKKLVEHYRPQIEAYRAGAVRMFHLNPQHVVGRLLFVSAGVLETVTEREQVRSEEMTQGRLW
jgi:ATP-dependent exoDNAse (exonuclease V) beta subunit